MRCHNLTQDEIRSLYDNTDYVCRTAVEVGADSSQFPSHWLFKHRWVLNFAILYARSHPSTLNRGRGKIRVKAHSYL